MVNTVIIFISYYVKQLHRNSRRHWIEQVVFLDCNIHVGVHKRYLLKPIKEFSHLLIWDYIRGCRWTAARNQLKVLVSTL